MTDHPADPRARLALEQLAAAAGLRVAGGHVRRTSSRFCLGVEHGDYNGTELFGVGTDRFLWLAYRPNDLGRVRLFSEAFASEGVVDFALDALPPPRHPEFHGRWARFPLGVAWVLARAGLRLHRGFDAVLRSDIPGGGMSRSASLSLNLLLTMLEVNELRLPRDLDHVDLAQQVENDYIGSPCGVLDQTMIYFARAGHGTHYDPATRAVRHVPLGKAPPFALVSLDTGTDRPGLETSTYRVRRAECEQLVELARAEFGLRCLADVRDAQLLARLVARFGSSHPHLCDRLRYIHGAQARFADLLRAWRDGDLAALGAIFRADGHGLRDLYRISGPELETMCDIARTVPGVLGERMLGGGDKGAAGAIVEADSVRALQDAVATAYPRSHPEFAAKAAVHACGIVDGVARLPGL
jgi:galactokinase